MNNQYYVAVELCVLEKKMLLHVVSSVYNIVRKTERVDSCFCSFPNDKRMLDQGDRPLKRPQYRW